jgi:hypothetical protein
MTLHSLSDLRKAKIFVKDLEKILKLVDASEAALRNYEKYRPVAHILTTLKEERMFLEVFLEQNKAIVDSKGKRYK